MHRSWCSTRSQSSIHRSRILVPPSPSGQGDTWPGGAAARVPLVAPPSEPREAVGTRIGASAGRNQHRHDPWLPDWTGSAVAILGSVSTAPRCPADCGGRRRRAEAGGRGAGAAATGPLAICSSVARAWPGPFAHAHARARGGRRPSWRRPAAAIPARTRGARQALKSLLGRASGAAKSGPQVFEAVVDTLP